VKKLIINLLSYGLIFGLILVNEFAKIEYAGNLAMFCIWFIIVTCCICILVDSKALFTKELKFVTEKQAVSYFLGIFLVTIGWTGAGIFWLMVQIAVHIKYNLWLEEKEKLAKGS